MATSLSVSQPSGNGGVDRSSTASSSSWVTGELDERVVAKAALDAAEDSLESLCAVHAGTFVAVEKRGQAMEQALTELQSTIDVVKKKVNIAQQNLWHAQSEESKEQKGNEQPHELPDDDMQDRSTSLAVLSEKHRVRRRTLLQHSALLELLELPSLMDACVRSNLYEEALSIASLANSLERRPNENKVVTHVVAQIRGRQHDLRRHLLHRLEGSVTMPDCLEVVTALRRLNSIDLETTQSDPESLYQSMEVKLQIDFLEARNVWLDATASSTSVSSKFGGTPSTSTSSEDLLDTIERYRTRVFEIATQFNAIFRANPATKTSSSMDSSKAVTASADLLSLWTCRRVHAFLQLLQHGISSAAAKADAAGAAAHLASGSATSSSTAVSSQQFGAATLRDLLEAALFFASSMGRLGADFTAHVIPDIFEDALVDWIVQHCWVQQGVKPFQEVLQICNQVNLATPLIASGASSGSVRSRNTNIVWSNSSADEVKQLFQDFSVPTSADAVLENPIGPLRVFMQVPPLGRFVNAILFGLNELRRCLLPSALPRLEEAFEVLVVQVVAKELKQLERELITMPVGRDKNLREIITAEYIPIWNNIVIPYCRGSVWTAMGRGAQALSEFQTLGNAIDELVGEKEAAAAALLEKQRQEQLAASGGGEEKDEGEESGDQEGNQDSSPDEPNAEEADAEVQEKEPDEAEDSATPEEEKTLDAGPIESESFDKDAKKD